MPTLEFLAACMVLALVWAVTRWKRWVGFVLGAVVGVGAALLWAQGLRFGGPAVAAGDALGLALGWSATRRRSRQP